MAAGIGVYTVLDAVWLGAVPYPAANSLVALSRFNPELGHSTASWRDFESWQRLTGTFEQVGAFETNMFFVTRAGTQDRVFGIYASPALFAALGESALSGRVFAASDNDVVLLAANSARTRFSDVALGGSLTVNGKVKTIIGVLPPRFTEMIPAELVLPLPDKAGGVLQVIGRLRDGTSRSAATGAMDAALIEQRRYHPDVYNGWNARVQSLRSLLVGENVGRMLWLLIGVVGLLQVAAAANASLILILVTDAERRDVPIQLMLGATLRRMVAEACIRALMLTGLAGLMALTFIYWTGGALVALIPPSVPRLSRISVNADVAVFSAVLAAAVAVLVAYAPTLFVSRASPIEAMRSGVERRRSRLVTLSVIGQTALGCAMAIVAITFAQNFHKLTAQPLGFVPDNLITFLVQAPNAGPFDWRRHEPVTRALLTELEQSEAVRAFAGSDMPPFSGMRAMYSFQTIDTVGPAADQEVMLEHRLITPRFFETLAIPLMAGRDFSGSDQPGSPPVAIVNEVAARRFWPGIDPIGHRVSVASSLQPVTIVGIVGNVRQFGFDRAPIPQLYRPWLQDPRAALTMIVRPNGAPGGLLRALAQDDRPFGGGAVLSKIRLFDDYLDRSVAQQRFRAQLLLFFAATATLIVAVGGIAVTATSAMRRRREIAIRLALGARASGIARAFVLRESLVPSLIGVAAGTVLALALGGILRRIAPDQVDWTPMTFALACAVILVSSGASAYLATGLIVGRSPSSLLRSE